MTADRSVARQGVGRSHRNGNVTYTVYNYALNATTGFINEVRVYPGWHAVTGGYTTTGPVQVTRTNDPGSYSETPTYDPGTLTGSTPSGTDTIGTSGTPVTTAIDMWGSIAFGDSDGTLPYA